MLKRIAAIRFSKVIEALVWLVGLGVLANNILLLEQNRSLRDSLAPQIASGAHVERLAAVGLDGRLQPVVLPSAGSKLLIITFSPGCPACQANRDGWMKLGDTLEQKGMRVLWVSRDPMEITRDYCLKHGIRTSDALADPPYRTYLQLGLGRVPNTILVKPDGTVEKVWAGRLDQAGWSAMFAYFGQHEDASSPTAVEVDARSSGCGSTVSQTSVKSCN